MPITKDLSAGVHLKSIPVSRWGAYLRGRLIGITVFNYLDTVESFKKFRGISDTCDISLTS